MATAIFGTCIYGGGTMIGYLAFTKKEFIECIRSYKFMILIIVFLAFGFMNPIFAKYMPELLKSMMPDGMSMKLPEPTVFDSWTQFFKNMNQMGLIIFLLSFSSIISAELQKGTLINMVTKGLSRKKIILSIYIGLMLLDMLPDIKTYNPIRLISDNMALLQETLSPDQVFPAMGICLVICIITYIGVVIVFNRKQL